MFLPPEHRHPGHPPDDRAPPKRDPPASGGTVVLWLVGLLVVSTFLAPIAGSSVLEAIWALLRR